MDWNFDGNEYDPMIPNEYERVVRGKHTYLYSNLKFNVNYLYLMNNLFYLIIYNI